MHTGHGILHHAASGGSYEMEKTAIPFQKADLAKTETWSPLHWACRVGSVKTINSLLESGFCESVVITTRPVGRWTPWSIAFYTKTRVLYQIWSIPYASHMLRASDYWIIPRRLNPK
jgi:hypothetical protein